MRARTIRPLRIEGDFAIVPLTRGYEAIIDASDAHLVEHTNWCVWVGPTVAYAMTNTIKPGARSPAYMHRVILGAPVGVEVDHRDSNGLDNRRRNIRLASHAENNWNKGVQANNRSGLKGIWFHAASRKWRASIQTSGRTTDLGLHSTKEEAHAAYTLAAIQLHGTFARSI